MKQAKDPKMPKLGSSLRNNDPITEDELVYQLTIKKQGARMLSKDKKVFLLAVLKNKLEILLQAKTFDSSIGTSLYAGLCSLMPVNTRVVTREASNSDLAVLVAQLLNPFKKLRQHILAQYKEERDQMGHNLRSSSNQSPKETPVLILLNESFGLLENLEKDVYSHRSVPTKDTAVMPVKLTSLQRQRKWSADLVPVPKQLQLCAMCGHKTTNLPPENQEVIEYNDQKEKEYQDSLKAWDSYMRKVSNGDKSVKKPNGLKRRPQRRGHRAKEPIIVCKCSISYCLGNSDGESNCCPIKCSKFNIKNNINDNDVVGDSLKKCEKNNDFPSDSRSSRYPFMNEGNGKYCSCPICMCKCSFACRVSDVPKILLCRQVQGKDSTDLKLEEQIGYDTKAPFFFQDIFKESAKICYKTIKEQGTAENLRRRLASQVPKEGLLDSDNDVSIENRGVAAACEFAATNIVSRSQALTMLTRKEMKRGIGKPSTIVKLPSGDFFNTKLIAGNNQHSTNNKLGGDFNGSKNSFEPHAGMKSNLEIDWSKQSDQYIDLIEHYSDVKKEAKGKPEPIIDDYEDDDDSIQFLNVKPAAKKHKDDVIINREYTKKSTAVQPLVKIKSEFGNNSSVSKVSNMHSRIIKKARNKLTRAIKKTLETPSSEEVKVQARKLKSTVLMIENSEITNSNLNIIKAVTSDGKDLELDNVSSEEVLERVSLYHELDN